MKPKSSPKRPASPPEERTVRVPAENGRDERDLARGEGGAIEIPSRPGDLSKDD